MKKIRPLKLTWYIEYGVNTLYAYARKSIDGKTHRYSLHRLVTDAPSGKMVDHKDGNGLNNRSNNLRVCNRNQNNWNQSKRSDSENNYKGVGDRGNGSYVVRIQYGDERYWVGTYYDERYAAQVYNECAKLLYGEFAYLNDVSYRIKDAKKEALEFLSKKGVI